MMKSANVELVRDLQTPAFVLRAPEKKELGPTTSPSVVLDGALPLEGSDAGCVEVSVREAKKALDVVHGLKEARISLRHNEVDGVEVTLAAEAASEVGAGARGRVETATLRAAEGQSASPHLCRYLKLGDNREYGDVVSQSSQVFGGNHINRAVKTRIHCRERAVAKLPLTR